MCYAHVLVYVNVNVRIHIDRDDHDAHVYSHSYLYSQYEENTCSQWEYVHGDLQQGFYDYTDFVAVCC